MSSIKPKRTSIRVRKADKDYLKNNASEHSLQTWLSKYFLEEYTFSEEFIDEYKQDTKEELTTAIFTIDEAIRDKLDLMAFMLKKQGIKKASPTLILRHCFKEMVNEIQQGRFTIEKKETVGIQFMIEKEDYKAIVENITPRKRSEFFEDYLLNQYEPTPEEVANITPETPNVPHPIKIHLSEEGVEAVKSIAASIAIAKGMKLSQKMKTPDVLRLVAKDMIDKVLITKEISKEKAAKQNITDAITKFQQIKKRPISDEELAYVAKRAKLD